MIDSELAQGKLVALNVEGYQNRQSHLFQMRERDKDVGIVAQSIWERLRQAKFADLADNGNDGHFSRIR